MNFDFLDRRRAERFAELLDETNGGRRHHANRGAADDELAALVAIGHSLSAAPSGVRVDPEFRTGLRAMLVATAERDGIGVSATRVDAEPDAREPRRRLNLLRGGSGRRIRVRGAIVVSVAAGAMAVSGISAASESASPGDALYGVKRSTERAQLAMAGSDTTRGQLSLDFARTRLTEATAMDGDDKAFRTVLDDMDRDTRQGVRLLTSAAVKREDTAPLETVDRFVAGQRDTFSPVLDRLGPDNRERARTSLSLLDDVRERTESLRTGLACDTVRPRGSDALGPELAGCLTGSGSAEQPGRTLGTGGRPGTKPAPGDDATAGPERTGPAAEPSDSAEPDPGRSTPAVGEDPEPDRSETPADPGTGKDADEGVLGGLLGGILGS